MRFAAAAGLLFAALLMALAFADEATRAHPPDTFPGSSPDGPGAARQAPSPRRDRAAAIRPPVPGPGAARMRRRPPVTASGGCPAGPADLYPRRIRWGAPSGAERQSADPSNLIRIVPA